MSVFSCVMLTCRRYKASTGKTYSAEEDPGVKSVQSIFNYYKKHGYNTIGESPQYSAKHFHC